ncbi:MAG: hypothetical protein A2381_12680 [Bdellovibrionales bacterium RIFOXYB1_FULL_37_110]|nr:MAG: hypothetical protein A2181_07410 [Bdellovibrionales bacterium RIFOXYA1_FULL_38_20]OFZ51536.1 MAG: hypothetical protein A2417_12365 [Bdellovibrionales bacterium RIFOXYC1_FULL_37_79]OFZ60370.1 MAG: hypothetical protein A2381_12680 [Bdellovibrionales bacterium RIFOXYB1_FULL_37_110]OFZ63860.1 MAG: hypothetical protein A2577_05595 [Bdellovibrionales bacterium RIFOXYD1_FULL_36_51]
MFKGNKFGGIRAAVKILQTLTSGEREKILQNIEKKDPQMFDLLKNNLVVFEDLQFMTSKMIGEFLKEVSLADLALALKTSSDELKNHFYNNISSGMKKDLEDIMNKKLVPVSQVEAARAKIMEVVRKKVETGQLILDPQKNEEYV